MDCLFCRIVSGEIPAKVVHQDDDVLVISDINPQAPQHLLVFTREHFANINDLASSGTPDLMGRLVSTAAQVGREQASDGFRLVVNTGPDGGQTIEHVHVHVLAGRPMSWPPG